MKIAVFDHHGKSAYLKAQLAERFEVVSSGFEILLVDSDHPFAVPFPDKHQVVKGCGEQGIPVVLYPHGGMLDLDYDGIRPIAPQVTVQLLHGEGPAEVYRRAGVDHWTEVVGWTYGPLVESSFPPSGPYVESILFAPIHPWANGQDILPQHRTLNHLAYQEFLEHPAKRKVVRMYGEDVPNGVHERVEGVEYAQSDLTIPWDLLAEMDAVISYGTLAHAALSIGKPVAMIYGFPGHTSDDGTVTAAHFADYADYVRYPASIGDAPLDELFRRDVSGWKDLFVGGPLNLDKLEETLWEIRPNRATRRALAQ